MATTDLSQQHVVPDPPNALPTSTLVDETQRLSLAGETGLGSAGSPARSGVSTEQDLKESARRQVEAALKANTGSSSSAGTTGLQQQQQHVIPDKSTALPTNSLINETQQLSDRGTTGLGGSSVQTVGNTSASFTPKTTSDTTPSSAAAGTTGSAPLLSDQIPADVKQAAATASQAVASQVEVAKQGLDHAFNKSDAITPGNELPGGWGPTPPATTTGPHATTTIYQDISTALDKVGQAAYNAVPASLIEKLHASPAGSPVKTTTTTASPITTTTNTVPHQAGGAGQAHPTTAEDIGAAVKDGVAAAQVNVKAAADKAVELGKNAYNSIPAIPSAVPSHGAHATAPSTTTSGLSTNKLPTSAQIIPQSRDATSGSSLATTEIPSLADIKQEAVHLVDQAKELLGFGGATHGASSDSHAVKAVDAGPKVNLLSSSHEIAPAVSGQSTASATRGEVTPSQVKTTALAGGGGLAATIADEVADAARHSHATTVGDGGDANAAEAAKGGLAATIAPDVARAAQHSTATTHANDGLDKPSVTGEQSALAGGGGLAATIADDVARAAKESPATTVGATGANAIPVAEGHHSAPHGAQDLNLGRPVEVGTAGLAPAGVGAAGVAAGAAAAGHGQDSSKSIPEPRETSHAPSALQAGAVPTSSTGPTSVLSGDKPTSSGAGAAISAPSSTSAAASAPSSTGKNLESGGPHGLIQTTSGLKHRHELTADELAAHDQKASASGLAATTTPVAKGSSAPPHSDIDMATPLSPAKSSHSDSTTASGHKKKMSIGEKIKAKLHIGHEKE